MRRLTQFTVLIALSSLALRPSAQEPERADATHPVGPALPPLATRISAFLEAHHTDRQFSGTALVADDGKIVYQGAFGLANDDWNIPNGANTKFRLGGMTQQFTAMLVLLLVEEGKLELDAPIVRYLPDYPPEGGSKVTIHHLLNHSSGIPSYREHAGWQEQMLQHHPVGEFVARFCSGPLEFEPGTHYRHNHGGYYLLGAIVEAVTGQTYAKALRERVLDPLEMHDTGHEDQNAVIGNRATGYEEVSGERRIAQWDGLHNLFASAGLYSTVGDLWKWEQALRSERLLSGELEKRMFTPGQGRYGYGWHIDPGGIWHGGSAPGFSTMIGRLPSLGQSVILLGNSGFSAVPAAAQGIAEILKGNTPAPPTRRPWYFAQHILDHGIEAGLEALAGLPEATRNREVEPTLRLVGYRLLANGRPEDAVRLFEFSTRAFSQISWRWESLGEAHVQAGNRKFAIENFRRALQLNPESTGARRMLEKLERK